MRRRYVWIPVSCLVVMTMLMGLVTTPIRAFTQNPATVFINEIHYDNAGTDTGEAIEIAGPAGTDLAGWSIVLYNGTGGAVYDTDLLNGSIPNQQNGFGTVVLTYASNGIQNGAPDGIALVDATNTVVQFLSYEGTFTAVGGPANGMLSTDISVLEAGTESVGQSLQLAGTGSTYQNFTWTGPATSTFGAVNTGQMFVGASTPTLTSTTGVSTPTATSTTEASTPTATGTTEPSTPTATSTTVANACGQPATRIHDVQGAGNASPLVGQTVTIQGVVVGDFQEADGDEFNTDLDGFYVQEEQSDYDADPLTSEGIFVFTSSAAANVVVGDEVRVTGNVVEFNTLTEVDARSGIGTIVNCGDGGLPDSVEVLLPIDTVGESVSGFERYEGMLVEFPQALRVSEYFNFDRFGEIVLCDPNPADPALEQDRLYQPTSIDEPGSPGAVARAEYNEEACITLDDARSEQNPDPARHPNGQEFTLENHFRGGDVVQEATGILDYRFNLYRIQPTEGATYVPANLRPEQPPTVGGDLKVASFNVLNYFSTLDSGPDICGPAQNLECRGADNENEFQRQRDKIIEALARIDADIVGLIELENTNNNAIEDLVAGLNERYGVATYTFINTGTIGGDAIRDAFIYKPSTVTPVGGFEILTSAVDPRFVDTRNRPALAQTFRQNSNNGVLTVAVNHFKSKGSGCGAGDDDPVQGNCNGTRTQAAEALVDWLATDPTGSNDPDFLIIGDLNAYDKEDPIDAIREGADDNILTTVDNYTDLEFLFGGEYAYGYLFNAQFGYLDYALAIQSLVPQVTGSAAWHINADEPDILDYDTSFKKDAQDALYAPDPFRSSDHDPVIVGLTLTRGAPATPTATATNTPTPTDTATNTPTNTATPSPTATATNTPTNTATASPTDTATVTATATPVQSVGKVTGGGTVMVNGERANFSFNVDRKRAGAPIKGNLRYRSPAGANVRSVNITSLTISGNTATFSGSCTINRAPCTFTVQVQDNGEPGRNDTFVITVSGSPAEGGRIRGGNIQVHKQK